MEILKEPLTTLEFMQEVLASYKKTASLQSTADELKISYSKVRKILITIGEYKTDFSIEVGKRKAAGLSIKEIASELNASPNRVTAFLPYEKELYNGPKLTADAKKSKVYRKRIKVAKEKFVNSVKQDTKKNKNPEGRKEMIRNNSFKNEKAGKTKIFEAVHLHLELSSDYLDENEERILRQYGQSSTGKAISRDILIPSDMPLHHLHYALQRLFGWQNSHLRRFILPDDVYSRLTESTVKGWAGLVGILFQPPGEAEHDIFWDDDYESGSIKTWLKKKYTGPYHFRGLMEDFEAAQDDIQQMLERFPMLEVGESFNDYLIRTRSGKKSEKRKIIKKAPLIELTLEEMNNSIIIEGGTENLLERLEVAKILAYQDQDISCRKDLFPVSAKLIYNYDFGDDWNVTITKEKDCKELLQKGSISQEELLEAEATVLTKHKPVCIHRDGAFVLDDVGGLSGFARFLEEINEGEDEEERNNSKIWAQSLGWSSRKIADKMIL